MKNTTFLPLLLCFKCNNPLIIGKSIQDKKTNEWRCKKCWRKKRKLPLEVRDERRTIQYFLER